MAQQRISLIRRPNTMGDVWGRVNDLSKAEDTNLRWVMEVEVVWGLYVGG